MGKDSMNAIFLPASASGAEDIRTQIMSALQATKPLKK